MLISTTRLYERCLLGFESPDEEIQLAARSCLSFLVLHMKLRQVSLPEVLVPLVNMLPKLEKEDPPAWVMPA